MTPALIMTPLSTAEAGIGAAGWAMGSQTCSGTSPIFSPKPAISSASVGSRQGDVGNAANASRIARLSPGVAVASSTKPISRKISPSKASAR